MADLYNAYIYSYSLDPERDEEFFSYFDDLYSTPEVQGLSIYPQHGKINRLQHIVSVTYVAYVIAKEKNADIRQTLRGAILHDLFYYDWHVADDGSHRLSGYRHPGFALKNAKELYPTITEIEQNIIQRHMWPLTPTPPKYKESLIVSMADKYCATQEMLMSKLPAYEKKFNAAIHRT